MPTRNMGERFHLWSCASLFRQPNLLPHNKQMWLWTWKGLHRIKGDMRRSNLPCRWKMGWIWVCGYLMPAQQLLQWNRMCVPRSSGSLPPVVILQWSRLCLCAWLMSWRYPMEWNILWSGGQLSCWVLLDRDSLCCITSKMCTSNHMAEQPMPSE